MKIPYGTFIDMAALAVGGVIGLLMKDSFPDNIQAIIYQGIGLPILLIGLKMSFQLPDGFMLVLVFSMILGGIIGEVVHIDHFFNNLGDNMKSLINVEDDTFTEGIITTFLLCCIGSMTIIGTIEEGITGNRELLIVKSLLDLFSGILLATSFGIGVIFAIIPMLIYQGGITVLASRAKQFFSNHMINMVSTVGGLLLVGICINVLQLGEINLSNLLPALIVVALITWFYENYRQTKNLTS